MKIRINNSLDIETELTLNKIAKKIQKRTIDVNEGNNLIYWEKVWSVIVV